MTTFADDQNDDTTPVEAEAAANKPVPTPVSESFSSPSF
jgi:hypothetical protein